MNISGGGMGLFAVANLPVGSQIEVEFPSPESGLRTRIPGTIRHRALYLYGIEFLPEAETRPNRTELAAEF
jgi:PilZ domain